MITEEHAATVNEIISKLNEEVTRLRAELKGESELYIQKARELTNFKAQVYDRLEEVVGDCYWDVDDVNGVLKALDLPTITQRQRYELSISVVVEVDADGDSPDWDNVTFDVDLAHTDFTVSEGTVDDVYVNSVNVESNEAV